MLLILIHLFLNFHPTPARNACLKVLSFHLEKFDSEYSSFKVLHSSWKIFRTNFSLDVLTKERVYVEKFFRGGGDNTLSVKIVGLKNSRPNF